MALKLLRKKTTKLKSFLREYSMSLFLSPCPFVISMLGIAFQTDEYYVFAQEYALAGHLFDIIPPQVQSGGGQTDRQADRHTGRQTDWQTLSACGDGWFNL